MGFELAASVIPTIIKLIRMGFELITPKLNVKSVEYF
jgi:hypothetical protein